MVFWNCIENFAKLLKVLREKFERAKSHHFRGCEFCKTNYSNFSIIKELMAIKSRENMIGAWFFLIGVVLAIVVGFLAAIIGKANITPFILGVLAILGLVVGYFVSERDAKTFLFASVSLVLVSFAGIQGLVLSAAILGININELITSVLGALLFLFIPSTIVVALKTVFSIAKS